MSTRNKYICREIPQPDFVASFDGDMVVGQLKDATFIPGEDGQDGQDGTPGTNGQEVTLQTTATHIQWRLGTGEWQNLVALTELMGTDGQPGTDGQEVTLQTTATHIQWRLGAGEWQNLIALSELVPTEYPAKNVKVDEAPVPDYTAVALNDNLQQVTDKVAGLQRGADIAQIAAKLTETTYEQIPLDSFTINGAVGSGSYDTPKHRYLYIKTGATSNSSFYARTSRLSSGYFSGVKYVQIRWDRDMLLSFRGHVVDSSSMTENSQRWVVLGANEKASPTNPNYKSIGIRSDFNTMYGIVHDGNALTEVDLGVNYSGGNLTDVTIKFYANEKVEWWVDGILRGNSTNIPINIGDNVYNTFGVSIINGSDSVHNAFMINDMKFWGAKL